MGCLLEGRDPDVVDQQVVHALIGETLSSKAPEMLEMMMLNEFRDIDKLLVPAIKGTMGNDTFCFYNFYAFFTRRILAGRVNRLPLYGMMLPLATAVAWSQRSLARLAGPFQMRPTPLNHAILTGTPDP
eukprot:1177244-Prorocentrum_minimum.AAC.1